MPPGREIAEGDDLKDTKVTLKGINGNGIRYVLFDLDNTIYPASTGLQDEINRRIALFLCDLLDLTLEEALPLRHTYSMRYGSTLNGLLVNKQIADPEDYLRACHPEDLGSFLSRDLGVFEALSTLPYPRSILTNSPLEHAQRVLDFLGLGSLFEHIFDIRFHRFKAKPNSEVYRRVLTFLSLDPADALFVDDRPDYLLAFRDLGGKVVLVDELQEQSARATDGMVVVRSISELPGLLNAP